MNHMKNIAWFLLLSIISISHISCSSSASEVSTKKEEVVVKVRAVKIESKELELRKTYFGKANYHQSMTYVADMPGQVLVSNVKSGQRIKKGDVLFSYPPINHELQVEQASLTYKELKDTYDRQVKLFKIGSVAKIELKRSKTQMDVQMKELERLEKLNVIIAPFSGIVTDVFVRQNEEIAVDDKICSIANTEELKLSFYVPLNDISSIHVGNTVYLEYLGQQVLGKVSQKAIQMDKSRKLFHVEASFKEMKDFNGAGATFKVNVVTHKKNDAILIPRTSTKKKKGAYYAYFIKNNKALIRKIKYKQLVGMDFLIENGVNEGELLIIEGVEKLKDGQRIERIK